MIVGIDPGGTGAFAFLDDSGHLIRCVDMPAYKVVVGKTKSGKPSLRTRLDLPGIRELLEPVRGDVTLCAIEEVGAMPKQGVQSMFTFGFSAGAVNMAVVMLKMPLVTLRPQSWRKLVGLKAGSSKADGQLLAGRLFPSWTFPRSETNGQGDAALIAEAARRQAKIEGDVAW